MATLLVVNNPRNWPLKIPGVQVVAARQYLTDPQFTNLRGTKIFNLCRSYRYQSLGYYVSLLAEARGHKPVPNATTIQDLKSQTIIRSIADDLDQLIQRSLAPIQSKEFVLSIYFGRNLAKRYERLSLQLFNLFPAPLLRAHFRHQDTWQLDRISPVSTGEIPESHREFMVKIAGEYFARRRQRSPRRASQRFDLAILYNPVDPTVPSNATAIRKFMRAAAAAGFSPKIISSDDYGRIAEFDALFIRETTRVHHHTYRFARRAAAEGLAVVDDPESILKCTNKVYLAELLNHHRLRTPRTVIANRDNLETVLTTLGLPCILKQPDSSSSLGVVKVEDRPMLEREIERLLEKSELVLAQEYLPTSFDWRVGVFDRQPLYVCKYYMADDHWQIAKYDQNGERHFGRVESIPVESAPRQVVRLATRAANLIGNGLYGVDLKQLGRKCYVIEVNDNPNIDGGFEDAILKDKLYARIMEVLFQRVTRAKEGGRKP
jgi:glutathione synthase/RimK-type ligase-like ATP-grasp enzyme